MLAGATQSPRSTEEVATSYRFLKTQYTENSSATQSVLSYDFGKASANFRRKIRYGIYLSRRPDYISMKIKSLRLPGSVLREASS